MSATLKKTLNFGLAILLMASVGASTSRINVNARHVRTHRMDRHHSRKMRVRKHAKKRQMSRHKRTFKRRKRRLSVKRTKRSRKRITKRRRTRRYRKGARNKRTAYRKYRRSFKDRMKRRGYRSHRNHRRTRRVARHKSNYEIGVDKITKYLMDQSQGEASEADAKSDAEIFMKNGDSGNNDPELDSILAQYRDPTQHLGGPATDPNLPIAKQDAFDKATEARTIYDLQQDRASLGEDPLTVSPALTHLAEERAPQLEQNFSHYDSDMTPYTLIDDPENKANSTGENISDDPAEYSPKAEADGMNDGLFYDERPTQENPYGGGHYQAIKYSTSVGVGYENGFLAEDFNDANL